MISFCSNPKEGQCQRMFILPENCAHFTCQQGNGQNPPSQASLVCEPRTRRCTSWIQKRQKNQRSNGQYSLDQRKIFKKICFIDQTKPFDCVVHNKLWKILQEMGIPGQLTSILRNLYAGQEATVRIRHGTTDWFQIRKGLCQGCILSPCLFTLYVEYIMRNTGLVEA